MAVPTAELLGGVCGATDGDRIALGEIMDQVEGRAHGLVLILVGLPEAIPMVGLSAILAAPIFVVGCAMVLYGADPPLPGWLRRRSVPRSRVEAAIERALPVVRRLDRLSRPRWVAVATAGRPQGVVLVLMAVLLAVPIPGVNLLAAFAVVGTGIGILQRDGFVIGLAALSALLALAGAAAVAVGGVALWEWVTG